jgi:methylmalonyl-CoA mutase N-terminal domain/subunit
VRLIVDTIEFCARQLPRFNPVSICGYHIRESGATPAQEMAYALLIAKTYAQKAIARGLHPDEFLPRFAFNFDIFGNLFEQVAKFRAGRRLWAHITRDELGARNPRSMLIRMIAGGGGGGLTVRQPENNIIRGAYYALASALSGTQTMALCSYDEAYTIPSKHAALLSLRTMQILLEETGVCDTVDPLAGSYYVEWLTNEMEKKIRQEMEEIEKVGGIIEAIATGYVQRKLAVQAYEMEKKIRSGEVVKVGVNKYTMEEEKREVELHRYRPEAAEEQIRKLNQIRRTRDNGEVKRALDTLAEKAATDENLMPYIQQCVRAHATVGEITNVFRQIFGEFKEPSLF